MSRIAARFEQLKARSRKALIPFVTAGDPNPQVTVPLMHAMVAAGADIIELGVPFSDPMADGPVIQRASERALEHHVGLRDVMAMVREFRTQDNDTPVVLMGYLNPIEVLGYQAFAEQAAAAGVDGALIVDIPPEEGRELLDALAKVEMDQIYLLAPTSTEGRIKRICEVAGGFVYYVSVKGVTGSAQLDVSQVESKVAQIRAHTQLPVGVGFGISDGVSAKAVAKVADAVVVGSAIVKRIEALADKPGEINAEVGGFVGELRRAIDER